MAGSQYYASESLPANSEILIHKKGKIPHSQNVWALKFFCNMVQHKWYKLIAHNRRGSSLFKHKTMLCLTLRA